MDKPKTMANLKQIAKLVGKGTPKKAGSYSAGGLLTLQDITKQMMITRSINKVLNTVNNEGRTALHLAALMNRLVLNQSINQSISLCILYLCFIIF